MMSEFNASKDALTLPEVTQAEAPQSVRAIYGDIRRLRLEFMIRT
jgi:hypothetical protein